MLKRTVPDPVHDLDPLGALAAGGGEALWARQGAVCAESGDLVGALQCFQRALESNLDCADAWSGLSEVFRLMGDSRR
ncbi:MAG TPA: tetratricopeptide repeat protein, partial [Candidatus Polarisedimenticolia bacterium]|nr:tetratricopeptide repeat protein [Candidatus Polarisedimenticolia bacterium]